MVCAWVGAWVVRVVDDDILGILELGYGLLNITRVFAIHSITVSHKVIGEHDVTCLRDVERSDVRANFKRPRYVFTPFRTSAAYYSVWRFHIESYVDDSRVLKKKICIMHQERIHLHRPGLEYISEGRYWSRWQPKYRCYTIILQLLSGAALWCDLVGLIALLNMDYLVHSMYRGLLLSWAQRPYRNIALSCPYLPFFFTLKPH